MNTHFIESCQRVLLETLIRERKATSECVRRAVRLPHGKHPAIFGSVPGPLRDAGIIRRIGFSKSVRRLRHGAPASVWELVDEHLAHAWLRQHPGKSMAQPNLMQGELFPEMPIQGRKGDAT